MDKCNSIETIDNTKLTEETKIRIDKMTEIENCFYQEKIRENYEVKN